VTFIQIPEEYSKTVPTQAMAMRCIEVLVLADFRNSAAEAAKFRKGSTSATGLPGQAISASWRLTEPVTGQFRSAPMTQTAQKRSSLGRDPGHFICRQS